MDTGSHWPLDGFEVRTPKLTLRYCDDELAQQAASLAARGIHASDYMPFLVPWSLTPSPQLERSTLQHHWRMRSTLTPESWSIAFGVLADGELVGCTDVGAREFALLRTVSTGSWLGQDFQGRGYGKEFRRACLAFAFNGLGADRAETTAWDDNGPSLGVTKAMGYEPNGDEIEVSGIDDKVARRQLRFKMGREQFDRLPTDDITFHGLERVRELLGLEG